MRNKVLSILFVCLFALTVTAAVWAQVCVPPPLGMVGWWPGDGNANDIVGGHNGTLVGGVTFAPGKVGQAFSLNGVDGYVNVGSAPAFDVTDFTIDAWVLIDPVTNTGERRVISRDDFIVVPDPTRQAYVLKSSSPFSCAGASGRPTFGILKGGIVSGVCAPSSLTAGFHYLAGVRSGSIISLYVDGVLVASTTTPITGIISPNAPLVIGQVSPASNIEFFAGLIDEVEIFNRALTPAEILAIFGAGSAGKCKPGTARAAYVANAGSNTVSVINPTTNTVVATIPVGPNPVNIAVTPNGASAYVTNAGSNSVSVINTSTNTVMATVSVGFNPVNVAITPDGTKAYVTNAGANTVSVISTATNTVVATVLVGPSPVNVAITPDGTNAYVTNAGANTVSVISTATNTVLATVIVGLSPVNVALH